MEFRSLLVSIVDILDRASAHSHMEVGVQNGGCNYVRIRLSSPPE
jgi:hypothetical protein